MKNIFESKSQAIVIPVNCEGVLGAGLAKQFNDKYKIEAEYYKSICSAGAFRIGSVLPILAYSEPKWFICFPTKDKWKNPSELAYIFSGLKALKHSLEDLNIASVAIPALGCGLGGLSWITVKPMIESFFKDGKIELELYDPRG